MAGTWCNRPRRAARGISLAFFLSVLPGGLVAQMAASDPGLDEATAAHRKAEGILADASMDEWPQAAALLEQAAAARAPGDAAALAERVSAAQLLYMSGALGRAQDDLEAAARQALAADWIYDAAQLLLKACIVAGARGQLSDAAEYARAAEHLADSPRLTPAQSARIRSGIIWRTLEPRRPATQT